MSYDLMVFEPSATPRDHDDFMEWYDEQTEWSEERDYSEIEGTSENLKIWFLEMIETFPALNGSHAPADDTLTEESEDLQTDYCIGTNVIYCGFRWSNAEKACNTAYELAQKHNIGFFDASGGEDVVYPGESPTKYNTEMQLWQKPWFKYGIVAIAIIAFKLIRRFYFDK